MLRLDKLSKRYGDHPVFNGLNHHFTPGCVALCEEDSTGKSTLLRIIAGALAPSSGDVWIDGQSISQARQHALARLAYIPDDCLIYPDLTGRALLERIAHEKHTHLDDATLALADALELTPHLDKRFEQMSTGMRRKVFITAAALGSPAVIIADGPSNGLDAPACAVLADQFKAWSNHCVVLFASFDPELVSACAARPLKVADLR